MPILIFFLKVMEVLWYTSLTRDYDKVFRTISIKECIAPLFFTILLLIPLVFLVCKKIKDRKEFIIILLIFTLFLFIWLSVFMISIQKPYPISVKITRFLAMVSNITIWGFCASKWKMYIK